MAKRTLSFPPGFRWGVSTSAGQIEGAAGEDGRGASIWDTFASRHGSIFDGSSPEVACDHYHRHAADFDLIRSLGIRNYRMSIAWPRVIPSGSGSVNERGLAFYETLVDELLEREIEPLVTLYHWDLPDALQASGGWAARATVDAFERYTEAVVRRLGDRVKRWVTINEPWTIASLGYIEGAHAPSIKNLRTALQVAHHLLLAHGRAARVIHDLGGQSAEVGLAHPLEWVAAASPSNEDRAAAARRDGAVNRWFLDPVYRAAYPEDMWSWYGAAVPSLQSEDLKTISEPIDFLGVDYYTRTVIAHDRTGGFLSTRSIQYPFVPHAEIEVWEVNPEGLYLALMRLHRDYGTPRIVVTGNGTALPDRPDVDGKVRDPVRIEFLRRHIAAVWQAIQDGVDVGGYYIWSIMDNFEWDLGFSKRFGLTHVDFETQVRTPKDSAYWYGSVSAENRVSID